MPRRFFNELLEHIGAIKVRLYKKDRIVFGLIVAVLETDGDLTKDSIVQFKEEGTNELCELRIAAFEKADGIISEINEQLSPTLPINSQTTKLPSKKSKREMLIDTISAIYDQYNYQPTA